MIRSIASLALLLWACGRDKSDDDTGEAPALTGPLANKSSFEIVGNNVGLVFPTYSDKVMSSTASAIFNEYAWNPNLVMFQELFANSEKITTADSAINAVSPYLSWYDIDHDKGDTIYPSGLAFFGSGEPDVAPELTRFGEACSNDNDNDCFSNKGVMATLYNFNNQEKSLAVINLHLDAGDTEVDIEARKKQLEILTGVLKDLQAQGVKYFVLQGDWNYEEVDANFADFESFLNSETAMNLGLYDACDEEGIDCAASIATLVAEINATTATEEDGCDREQNYDDSANLLDHFLVSGNLKVDGLEFGAATYSSDDLVCVASDHPIMRLQVSVKS